MTAKPINKPNQLSHNLWSRIVRGYHMDPHKYQRKKYGRYFGYLMIISYFTILPEIFKWALPYMLQHLPNKIIPFLGIAFLNTFIQIVYNLVMYVIYKIKHPFFEQYRISNRPWPWQQNYEQWIKLLKKSIICIIINNYLIGGPLACYDNYTSDYRSSLQQIPQTKTIIWQFLIFLLVQDLTLYLGHSSLHLPCMYWIHKQHHEYNTTISIASQYSHPIQSIIVNIPSILGIKIVSMFYPVHAISIWVFITFRIVESSDAHTGYEFSWAQSQLLPYSAGSAYHQFHHSKNVGNFASFFKFWDTLFGTNIEYIKYMEKNNQIQQNDKKQ